MSHMFRPEVNVAALENVRTRLVQLQESILYFLRSINPDAPSTVSWPDLHSKFNVLIAKYLQLTNILADPTNEGRPTPLKHYTVYPHETPLTDQQVQHLSVLLRTKLTPEVEKEDEERLREAHIPGLIQQIGHDERKTLAALRLNIAMHDAVCRKALEFFEEQRLEVMTRVRYESDDEQGSNNNIVTSAAMAEKDRFEGEMDFLSGKTDIVFRDEWSFGPTNAGFSSDDDDDDDGNDDEDDVDDGGNDEGDKKDDQGNDVQLGAPNNNLNRDSWLYNSASSDDDDDSDDDDHNDNDEDLAKASLPVFQRTPSRLGQHSWREEDDDEGEGEGDEEEGDDEDEMMEEVPAAPELEPTSSMQHAHSSEPQSSSHMDVEDDDGDEEDGDDDFDTVMV
ncbi:hypothetical protein DFQ27_000393 [Actinomortierella ambigua]|uniref:Mediator of RNA polymerase II transcription subunit 8 n=1 Tax=Actinomortierella ambigua TaxID=1343610 RepID=A0A9P6U9Q9_9FUNG|nr:hypothetical protein DFQ27_000393 [Actinomortierella ambigua]